MWLQERVGGREQCGGGGTGRHFAHTALVEFIPHAGGGGEHGESEIGLGLLSVEILLAASQRVIGTEQVWMRGSSEPEK